MRFAIYSGIAIIRSFEVLEAAASKWNIRPVLQGRGGRRSNRYVSYDLADKAQTSTSNPIIFYQALRGFVKMGATETHTFGTAAYAQYAVKSSMIYKRAALNKLRYASACGRYFDRQIERLKRCKLAHSFRSNDVNQ